MSNDSIIVLIGTYGVGKTWVIDHLDSNVYYPISYDENKDLNVIINEFKTIDKSKICVLDLPIFVSTYLKLLKKHFNIRLILIQPLLEELSINLQKRGSILTDGILRKYNRYFRHFSLLAEFIGTSSQVLSYLQLNFVKINCGIYAIINKINNKCYIGSASNIRKRWAKHRNQLRTGTHHSVHLQAAWNKYGENAFDFKILEEVEFNLEKLIAREQYWLDILQTCDPQKGYNIAPIADSNFGIKRTEEFKEKLSIAMLGNTNGLGYRLTEEHKQKISEANRGKIVSDQTRKLISNALQDENLKQYLSRVRLRFRHSEETKQHLSTVQKVKHYNRIGKLNPFFGKKHTKETITKISKPKSEEGRLAIKVARLEWAKTRYKETNCSNCQLIFKQRLCEDKKFCSKKCSSRFYGNLQTQKGTYKSKCLFCNTEFVTKLSEDKKYCSRMCWIKSKEIYG